MWSHFADQLYIQGVHTDLSTLDQSRLQHLLYTQWSWSLSSPVGSRYSNSFSLLDLRESYSEYVLFEVLQWPWLLMFLGNHISSITQFFKCQSFAPLWNSNTFLLPKWDDYHFLLWLHLTTEFWKFPYAKSCCDCGAWLEFLCPQGSHLCAKNSSSYFSSQVSIYLLQ